METCTGGQWGLCSATTPMADDTCNGVDDNCDGLFDDGTGAGKCACRNLTDSAAVAAVKAATEICSNGIDDNCDGEVDTSPCQ